MLELHKTKMLSPRIEGAPALFEFQKHSSPGIWESQESWNPRMPRVPELWDSWDYLNARNVPSSGIVEGQRSFQPRDPGSCGNVGVAGSERVPALFKCQ